MKTQDMNSKEFEAYKNTCIRKAEHIWGYGDLPNDHIERTYSAFQENADPHRFISDLGAKYGLAEKH